MRGIRPDFFFSSFKLFLLVLGVPVISFFSYSLLSIVALFFSAGSFISILSSPGRSSVTKSDEDDYSLEISNFPRDTSIFECSLAWLGCSEWPGSPDSRQVW